MLGRVEAVRLTRLTSSQKIVISRFELASQLLIHSFDRDEFWRSQLLQLVRSESASVTRGTFRKENER